MGKGVIRVRVSGRGRGFGAPKCQWSLLVSDGLCWSLLVSDGLC